MAKLHDICALNDIPDRQARGFTLDVKGQALDIFIVREGEKIYGYLNRCPHTGVNLNWQPNQFIDITGRFIQCSTHGAQFLIRNGYCLRGPCPGESLTPVNLALEHGRIKIRQ